MILFLMSIFRVFNATRNLDIYFYALFSGFLFLFLFFFTKNYLLPSLYSRSALELSENIIVDNISKQVIKWTDISDVVPIKKALSHKYSGIAIDLYSEEDYFDKLTFGKKIGALLNKILYKTPVVINFGLISYDSEELILTFQAEFERAKNSSQH